MKEKISDAREEAGLSQQQLADAVGVNKAQILLWEAGKTRPYPAHVKRIAEATGRPLPWFTGEDDLILDLPRYLPEKSMQRLREAAQSNGRTCAEEAVAAIVEQMSKLT
jgi:transcriptional regulator with XRE-family HTH domain